MNYFLKYGWILIALLVLFSGCVKPQTPSVTFCAPCSCPSVCPDGNVVCREVVVYVPCDCSYPSIAPKVRASGWVVVFRGHEIVYSVPDSIDMNDLFFVVGDSSSNSMLPCMFGEQRHLVKRIHSKGEVVVGDFVVYWSEGNKVMHQIIEIGSDELGWFAIGKGLHNAVPDRLKIRESDLYAVVLV